MNKPYTREPQKDAVGAPFPCVVLHEPQLAQNIGVAARAMANCALGGLRLVRPCAGEQWNTPEAFAASSGAHKVLNEARVFDSLADALADMHVVLAVSARRRDLTLPMLTPQDAVGEIRRRQEEGRSRVALLFGPERSGLPNDAVAQADGVIWIPAAPAFSSFNLGQAVLLVCHAWFMADKGENLPVPPARLETAPATRATWEGFFEQLETALEVGGFLYPPDKKRIMMRNLRALFLRSEPTEQEVRTLRGVLTALVRLDPTRVSRRHGGYGS